ncbi:MAG: T9SS type A sorting domain-containing protein [Saprospiraceae bacterium]|uniref:T9SS type A sorting domain-containing protein n=1 Tax=Candidatus Opimibacter skivensis TaxID=2982028 RepID=A0A9D7SZ92_9BACT|nr:T9SS type A sorting domain-containing protein [Candidatus Opimibacter skivensis]
MAEGENCQWYDQPSGGNLLATGPLFQTMPLNSSATYFVESHYIYPGEIQSGGKTDTTGVGGLAGQAGYLLFETWAPFTLLSVTVYVPSDGPLGTRFVQLWSGDSLLAFKRFELNPGANVFDLNFNVPVGKFSLLCQQGNLWRNTGELDYPYPIGDVGQITTSSFGDHYYYYFYDWKIKKEDKECVSTRSAVHVILSATKEIEDNQTLSVFPNPTTGILLIDIKGNKEGAKFFRLLDASGREILKQILDNVNSFHLDLNRLSAGVYMLQISGDSLFDIHKLIKN